jgi:multidrug efflux pump subunit AcrA (membrane-fusion protein)
LIGVVKVRDFVKKNAIMIDQENIMQDSQGRDYVFRIKVVDGVNQVEKVFIETGMSYKDKSYVKSGLNADDIIVSKGARSIVDGETVHWEQ